MGREEIERKLRIAEETLEQAAARLDVTVQRLSDLDQERAAVAGESEIARRALSDLEQVIAETRQELAGVELQEARQALADAVLARDRMIGEAAAALDTAVTLLGQIEERRTAVAAAAKRLAALDPQQPAGRAAATEEPDILHEPWQRMVAAVKAQLDEELETELIDAAARSLAPNSINALPEHLRAVALERRRRMRIAALERSQQARRQ